MFQTKKINNVKVSKMTLASHDDRKVKGYKLFPELYPNIFICSRKQSGKTFLINTIIRQCIDNTTTVHIWASTLYKDDAWIAILKWLDSKGITVNKHLSLIDDDGNNTLDEFMLEHNQPAEVESDSESESSDDAIQTFINAQDPDYEPKEPAVKKKKRKSKYKAPEHLLVFDDLSGEIKNRALTAYYKKNRHYKAKTITSSQHILDIPPGSRKQQDSFIVFSGQNKKKLETIYADADIGIGFPEFMEVYKYATDKKYSFLLIDTRTNTFRKNFDEEIILN